MWSESSLIFDYHIRKMCQVANHSASDLKGIRAHLSQKSAEILVHRLVHLDFCNEFLVNYQIISLINCKKFQIQARFDTSAKPLLMD